MQSGSWKRNELAATFARGTADVDGVFHFAAMVHVGQSMYEIRKYTAAIACLFEIQRRAGRTAVAVRRSPEAGRRDPCLKEYS